MTYYDTKDAFAAIENGSKMRKPDELPFDLCFGGRRQFCKTSYADLGMSDQQTLYIKIHIFYTGIETSIEHKCEYKYISSPLTTLGKNLQVRSWQQLGKGRRGCNRGSKESRSPYNTTSWVPNKVWANE